jgi:putative transcription factor
MSNCDLCGVKPSKFDAEIEGVMMHVCEDCARFGKIKIKTNVNIVIKEARKQEIQEPLYTFISGYGAIVKNAREKLNLKQDEMAKRLNERESTLHQIESEHLKPSVALAQKLEHALHIHIMNHETASNDDTNTVSSSKNLNSRGNKDAGLTIGDMIKK